MTRGRPLLAASCAAACFAAAACSPRSRSSAPDVTTNSCALSPCTAFDAGSPACVENVCVAAQAPKPTSLVLLVSVPRAQPISPALQGLTVIVPYTSLRAPAAAAPPGTPPTGQLSAAPISASYIVLNSVTQDLGFNLGNNSFAFNVVPVHVTYRPLFAPSSLSGAGAAEGPLVDAADAGLPVLPIRFDYAISGASNLLNMPKYQGPNGTSPTVVQGAVQSGLAYEQTISPDPPFDRAYPPDVQIVSYPTFIGGGNPELNPDPTSLSRPGMPFATFDISGTDRPLDGWTAYLRDEFTGRVLSPVRTLSGMTSCAVGLPTMHLPQGSSGDSIANTQLVIAPPASEPGTPAEVFTDPALFPHMTYNALPAPVTVSGTVTWQGPAPAAGADIFFEAQAVYYAAVDVPDPCPGSPGTDPTAPDDAGEDAGPLTYVANRDNYEFVARTALDFSSGNGFADYTISLPQGVYRVIVRPRDVLGATAGTAAVQVVDGFDTTGGATLTSSTDAGTPNGPQLTLAPTVPVNGTALIGDGRTLAGAVVEALPLSCSAASVPDGGSTPHDTARCQPRYAAIPVSDDGTFHLFLDRGTYLIRVEPAESSALPWVSQVVSVTSVEQNLRFIIPAPVRRPLQLVDDGRNPISEALVRMFALPDAGPAVEVGRTYTDSTGSGTIYVDPAVR